MTDDWTGPEVGRAVERIELDIREIKADVKQQGSSFVTRGEFEAWRTGIDREVRDLKVAVVDGISEIRAELRTEISGLRSASPTWHGILPIGISALTLVILIITLARTT